MGSRKELEADVRILSATNEDMERAIRESIPGNAMANKLVLNLDEVRKMLESGQKFEKIKDITTFFGKTFYILIAKPFTKISIFLNSPVTIFRFS